MSKQFQFFLLPADIELVMAELQSKFGLNILHESSSTMRPELLGSPIEQDAAAGTSHVRCYLAPIKGQEIKLNYLPHREKWQIDLSSEVIEFSGCDFDGRTLRSGRFYFQTDFLLKDAIWKKKSEFIDWGDKIFRATKKLLKRSATLDAYVGPAAEEWRNENGGQFADFFRRVDTRPLDGNS